MCMCMWLTSMKLPWSRLSRESRLLEELLAGDTWGTDGPGPAPPMASSLHACSQHQLPVLLPVTLQPDTVVVGG